MKRTVLGLVIVVLGLAGCGGDDSTAVVATPTATQGPPPPTRTATLVPTNPPSPTQTPVATSTRSATAAPTATNPPSPTNTEPEGGTPTATPTSTQVCLFTPTGTPPPPGSPSPTFGGPTPIFLTQPDPTPPSVVTDYWPRFSPDGTTILFTRTVTDESGQSGKPFFLTISVEGGEVHEFPPPGPSRTPIPVGATRSNWSWDPSLTRHQIAFTGITDDVYSLCLVDVDGENFDMLSVAGTSNQVYYPSWFPDGVTVAVVDYGNGDFQSAAGVLRSIDTAQSTQVPLTSTNVIFAGEPAVSRNGAQIAFAGQTNVGCPYNQEVNNIWLLDLMSSQPFPQNLSPLDTQQGRTPDWSPDDAYLSYESTRFCHPNIQLYTIVVQPSDGSSEAAQATACEYNGNHSVWSPDGTKIAFSAMIPGTQNRGIAIIPAP